MHRVPLDKRLWKVHFAQFNSGGKSGAAAMLRQSGNILYIARDICSRSNRVLGFGSQHRVHLLMKGPCRTANSCKPGLVVGALRIACNGLCTAARFHTAEDNPGCRLECLEEHGCVRRRNCCPFLYVRGIRYAASWGVFAPIGARQPLRSWSSFFRYFLQL